MFDVTVKEVRYRKRWFTVEKKNTMVFISDLRSF